VDTAKTTLASHTLGADLEQLIFTGSGNFKGTGGLEDLLGVAVLGRTEKTRQWLLWSKA
jgi:hypothetical protein